MILLALDPGIDDTGWAVFRVPLTPPVHVNQYRGALIASGSFSSGTDAPTPKRLHQLYRGLLAVVQEHGPDHAIIEIPAHGGTYTRNRRKAETDDGFMPDKMAHAHRATGALMLACSLLGVPIDARRASGMAKKLKSEWVVNIWPDLGNRHSNEDQRDAIHLGATALRDYALAARRMA